jgi:hypothetical protein
MLQRAILLLGLGVAAGVVVGIAQAAQFSHGQGRFGAHGRQLGARNQRLGTQRMSQQKLLEYLLRFPVWPRAFATAPCASW